MTNSISSPFAHPEDRVLSETSWEVECTRPSATRACVSAHGARYPSRRAGITQGVGALRVRRARRTGFLHVLVLLRKQKVLLNTSESEKNPSREVMGFLHN